MINIFKPGAHGLRPHAPGFLKLLLISLHVVMCVCPPTRLLITSGVIWCNLDRVRLVKQVLRLYPTFNYFIRPLAVDKMDGRGHFNTAHCERLPKKTKVMRY